jgi:hypothetical protein
MKSALVVELVDIAELTMDVKEVDKEMMEEVQFGKVKSLNQLPELQ